jgi:hypothetical protein
MNKSSIWSNKDGLAVGFGTRDVEYTYSAGVSVKGVRQQALLRLRLADLGDTVDANDLINAPVLPSGAFIESAKLFVEDAAVGVNAVLDIGFAKASDGTALDDDGIDAAIATATLVDQYDVACDGGVIGTQLSEAARMYASYDTAAFTAGVVLVVVDYWLPQAA